MMQTTQKESQAIGLGSCSPEYYVQYGCGLAAPEQWTNFDASFTLLWEQIPILGKVATKNEQRFPKNVRFGNIVKGLPVKSGICRGVYASHVLEHLTLRQSELALRNTKQLLEPGGIFRVVVPDLEWAAREYVRRLDLGDACANEFLLDETGLGKRDGKRGWQRLLYQLLSTHEHVWMWDWRSLTQALERHGYKRIRRCSFSDCEDPMFSLVEDARRFEHAIAIEARA